MNTKTIFLAITFLSVIYSNAQEREDFISYDLYTVGSASYKSIDNRTTTVDLDGINYNHFKYDLVITLDNYYFRLDASGIAGTFLDAVFSKSDKNYLQSTNLTVGYLFYDNPITITSNSNLVLGVGGFIDGTNTVLLRSGLTPIKEDFGSYGFTFIGDYQLGDKLNVFAEYSRGKLKRGDGVKSSKNEFRTKVAYDIYNGIHLTLGVSFQKYDREEGTGLQELGTSAFSFGLLFK